MQAIEVKQAGGVEELVYHSVADPVCLDDGVVVKNNVCGVNFIDVYLRSGLYKPAAYPYIPGKEGAGVITAVGKNVSDFRVGERVAYATAVSGAYATHIALPTNVLVRVPDTISDAQAAAVLLQGLTAHYLTHSTFPLTAKHTLLIHAAAGGVGLLVIQMAKACGARVIGTVSSEEKKALALSYGADEIIIYDKEYAFAKTVRELTQGKGVDVVYDAVGKSTFHESAQCLKPRGMLVSYGQASGAIEPFVINKLADWGSLYLTRPRLNEYVATPEELNNRAEKVFALVAEKKLRVLIGAEFSLANARDAHVALESRMTKGKVILLPAF